MPRGTSVATALSSSEVHQSCVSFDPWSSLFDYWCTTEVSVLAWKSKLTWLCSESLAMVNQTSSQVLLQLSQTPAFEQLWSKRVIRHTFQRNNYQWLVKIECVHPIKKYIWSWRDVPNVYMCIYISDCFSENNIQNKLNDFHSYMKA